MRGGSIAAWLCLIPAAAGTPARADVPDTTVVPPVAIDVVPAQYPEFARTLLLRGSVRVAMRVEPDGTVDSVRIEQSFPAGDSVQRAAFDSSAARAARAWRFRPARKGGGPIRSWVVSTVRFEPFPPKGKRREHPY